MGGVVVVVADAAPNFLSGSGSSFHDMLGQVEDQLATALPWVLGLMGLLVALSVGLRLILNVLGEAA